MTRRPLDPRKGHVSIDTNVLHRDGSERDRLVDKFEALIDASFRVVLPFGVREEVMHPNTPSAERRAYAGQIFNLRPHDNAIWREVRAILQGNAQPGKHDADAYHLCEAAQCECEYFVTEDARILAKRDELASALPPSLTITTLAEFLAIFDDYEAGRLPQ
jgi:hypothetical protein